MKKTFLNKFVFVTTLGAILVTCVGRNFFIKEINAFTTKKGTVDVSSLNVRSNAGTGNNTVATLQRDADVTVLDEVNGDGMYWYKVAFNDGSVNKEGYVAKNYIKTESLTGYKTDRAFESEIAGFPESYKNRLRALHAEYPNWKFVVQDVDIPWDEVIKNESQVGLNLVSKNAKSSWKSTEKGAYKWESGTWIGYDSDNWVAAGESIIRYYMDPRNFLDSTNIFQFLSHGYSTGEQTEAGIEKMLRGTFMESKSSRLSATEAKENSTVATTAQSTSAVKQSTSAGRLSSETGTVKSDKESSNNVEYSSVDAPVDESTNTKGDYVKVDAPLADSNKGEFSDTEHGPGVVNGDIIKESLSSSDSIYASSTATPETENQNALSNGNTYVDMIMDAAKSSGVNPYVLAAMIIQEQGVKGSSGLISGTGGIYNFFNIEAYQSGNQSATSRGLAWAGSGDTYLRPWNTKSKAITGGAMYYGANYAKAGQNSFYLKKFNVLGANRYKHQYMTNIEGAKNEGAMLSRAYSEEDKKGVFTFYIPVYRNMPDTPATMPAGDGNPDNRLSSLSVTGYNITPDFAKDNFSYTLEIPSNVTKLNIKANPSDTGADVTGGGDIELKDSNSTVDIIVTAKNGTKQKYSINIKKGK